jgi:GntR family transcriptional regulator
LITIDYRIDKPIYEQIVEQFKINIVKGIYKPGDKVTSVRKMASMLDITPSTVSKAYYELERQGIIYTLRAKGTYISDISETDTQVDENAISRRMLSEIIELKHGGYSLDEIQSIVAKLYSSI